MSDVFKDSWKGEEDINNSEDQGIDEKILKSDLKERYGKVCTVAILSRTWGGEGTLCTR
jgi:hypothetical protein